PALRAWLDPSSAIGVKQRSDLEIRTHVLLRNVIFAIDLGNDISIATMHDHPAGPEAAGVPERADDPAERRKPRAGPCGEGSPDPPKRPSLRVHEDDAHPHPLACRLARGDIRVQWG